MDIHCRICSEPFSNVGGIHFSHSDMTAWHYKQFLEGKGCPCCCGDVDPRAEHTMDQAYKDRLTEKWARSIQSASDEDPPYPGFYEAVETPWTVGEWTDEPTPMWDRLTTADKVLLQTLTGSTTFSDLEREEGTHEGDYNIFFELPSQYFSEGPSCHVRHANLLTIQLELDQAGAVYTGRHVLVATEEGDGSYTVFGPVVNVIIDAVKSLEDYPCLDDELYSRLEAKAKDEAWTQELADRVTWAAEFLGSSESAVERLLDEHRDDISRDVDGLPVLDDKKAKNMLASYAGAPGWDFYQSGVGRAGTWIAVMNPSREDPGFTVSGWVLSPDGGAEYVEDIPFSEFSNGTTMPRRICDLPVATRVAFLDALSD